MTKRVLVTGADGFIGSHLTEALVARGYTVRALALYNSLNFHGWLERIAPEVRSEIEIITGDVRDQGAMRTALAGCQAVYNLAALIAIPYSYQAPESYVDVNVRGTLNVLTAARDLGLERVVQISTSEVYGTARYVPIDEEHPLNAQSPYAASKIASDQFALSFHASFGLPVAVCRPFNTYGPRQSARAVIPTIITQLLAGRRRIELGALHPTRDFTFAPDTASGMIAVGECDAAVGQVTNVGSGFEISVGDTAQLIAEVVGADAEIVQRDERMRPANSEVERLFAGIDKVRRIAGWEPAHAGREGFRRGLETTVRWFSDPANLSFYKSDVYNV